MTVLVVDDQPHVVAGMLSGINWKAVGAANVYKAGSAPEARDIIRQVPVDILLCDIEMPEESGLSLLKWIRDSGYPMECIFITSHADFNYAKQAIQYGGADYILQPARYEEIEKSLNRASAKIQKSQESKKYSTFGRLLYHQKNRIVHTLLADWLSGKIQDSASVIGDLQRLEVDIKMETPIVPVRIVFYDSGQINPENRSILLDSVIRTQFPPEQYDALFCALPDHEFALLLYNAKGPAPAGEAVVQGLNRLQDRMKGEFHCGVRCACEGKAFLPEQLRRAFSALSEEAELCKGEPAAISYVPDAPAAEPAALRIKHLETESPLLLCAQVKNYLGALSPADRGNTGLLRRIFADFKQVLSPAARELGISVEEIFGDKAVSEGALGAFAGMEELDALVDDAIRFFENTERMELHERRQLDVIVEYIQNNIEEDIRRADIAKAVHLNENYVSRLFKKQMNIPLKEFIIMEKMKLAKTLLGTTNLPISVISMKVGYLNFSHFSQTYKRIMGVSPTHERDMR